MWLHRINTHPKQTARPAVRWSALWWLAPSFLYLLTGCSLLEDRDQGISAVGYFPLEVGSMWAYVSDNTTDDGDRWVDTVRVFGTAEIEGHEYFLFGREGRPLYLRHDEDGRVLRFGLTEEGPWLLLDSVDGTTYQAPDSAEWSDMVTVQRNLSVETPSGAFADCIRFTFINARSSTEETLILASGVGIVVWRRTQGFTFRLTSHHIGPAS